MKLETIEQLLKRRAVFIQSKSFAESKLSSGLNPFDFEDWFKNPIIDGCVIHFTDFRY